MELGRYGVFGHARVLTVERARVLESLGYETVWQGGSPPADLAHVSAILDATSTLKVATGIVNVWTADAAEVARSYHRIEAAHPGRFLLGVGVGHPEATATYRSPYQTLVNYLDVLDAEGVPVEQRVVLDADPVRAQALGRASVKPYLRLTNYTSNLQRLGFTADDVAGEGSDRLVDALVVSGDDAEIRRRFEEHFTAGADHVAVQLIAEPDADLDAGFQRLAAVLGVA